MNIAKYPVKITLYKKGEMIYFSQLDIMHVLERALRRTPLALFYTQGFNPHVKISFSKALKLGVEGKIEVTLYFTSKVSLDELTGNLTPQLPAGLDIV
ncbi:MAG: DUF2344 domain-containing protein [Candidatus Omnitrophota bacterium]|nr:MAG: DUF2344 domain-containing protein [Candidatus Omnitrophota bacterium]